MSISRTTTHLRTSAVAAFVCLSIACTDRAFHPPKRIPRLAADLPASASNFYSFVSGGLPSTMEQYRFDFDPKDVGEVEKMLWCTLEPETTDPSSFAQVGTNTRAWYAPEKAKRHRGCESRGGGWAMSVLVDTTTPSTSRVFMVLSD